MCYLLNQKVNQLHRLCFIEKTFNTDSSVNIRNSISWDDWGPQSTCWFKTDEIVHRFITTSCGQRCVHISADAIFDPCQIYLYDFNPYNVRRVEATQSEYSDRTKVFKDEEILEHHGVFTQVVWFSLPYVLSLSPKNVNFGAVLMDEDCVIGVVVRR